MERLRRPLSLSDTRSVLATTGDVVVGAYARRIRRKRIGIALLGVLLIAGAGLSYWTLRAPDDRPRAGKYSVVVRCGTCKAERQLEVETGQVFPLACPACKERNCRQLWQCRKCGRRFVPAGGGIPTVCEDASCRSADVGSAAIP